MFNNINSKVLGHILDWSWLSMVRLDGHWLVNMTVLCPYTRPSSCYYSMFCLAFLPEEKCSLYEIKLSGRLGQSCLLRPLVFSQSSRGQGLGLLYLSSVPPSVTPKAGNLTKRDPLHCLLDVICSYCH